MKHPNVTNNKHEFLKKKDSNLINEKKINFQKQTFKNLIKKFYLRIPKN